MRGVLIYFAEQCNLFAFYTSDVLELHSSYMVAQNCHVKVEECNTNHSLLKLHHSGLGFQ